MKNKKYSILDAQYIGHCSLSICYWLLSGMAYAADGPASITTSPASRTVLQGSATTFTVTADGTAPLSYQWRKDGAAIPGATSPSYTLPSAQPADEANYSVVVNNTLGTATSAEAELLVDPGIITGAINTNLFGYANVWKYNQSGADLGTAWREPAFNDSAWPSGPGLLGLETATLPDTIRTPLALGSPQVITYYFRTHFNLPASAEGATLNSTNVLDDGAVYYLNGNFIGRIRVPEGQTAATLADNQGAEGVAEEIPLQNTGLAVGDNVLAVEVHQSGATSSDVVFGMALTATLPIRGPDNARPTLLSASSPTGNVVLVTYSERVEPATALNTANYTLNNGATITAAWFTNDNRTIALATSPIAESTPYTLTVSNVRDRAVTPNTILPNSQFNFVRASGTFASQDIGAPSIVGNVTEVAGGYNITAGGTNLAGASDQFTFNYQQVVGDFDIKMRVASLTLADAWSKAGLMARESLLANSRYAASFATPSISGAYAQWRTNTAGATLTSGSYLVNYPNTWLRLKRSGNLFTTFASLDGDAWYQLGSVTMPMSANAYIGMAVSASVTNGSAVATTTAQFRDFAPVPLGSGSVATALPGIEPLGPSTRRTGLVITEIMYKPAARTDGRIVDFVEIYNSNPYWEDISGYQLTGDIDYTFPANTILQGGAFMVVAKSPADIQAVYGLANVMGPYGSNLTTQGTLRLRNKEDAIFLEILYSNQNPWPVAADATGHSLVLARPSYGEGNPEAWSISDTVGGSPGRQDGYTGSPLRSVVINEFLANTDLQPADYIELYNHANQAVDISGCSLSDEARTNKFVIPPNTTIPARGFVVFNQTQLGFGLSAGGETIYFRSADGLRVIDALQFEAQASDTASGRYPDGASDIYPLAAPTPAASNSEILIHDIVINEIMYRPVTVENDDEYVELYNQGASAVNLSGWRFVAGIDFTFPSNAVLAPNSYLVIARNLTNLLARYPTLNATNAFGDYDGSLANRGERLALGRPDLTVSTNGQGVVSTNIVYVVVDEVNYGIGGNWGTWANEGGSSLELIDPRSNHRLAHNWTDSDETARAPWTTVTATGAMEFGSGTANFIELLALGDGEYLVDNVEVLNSSQANMVAAGNMTFDAGIGQWNGRGTHIRSSWSSNQGLGGGGCLHVRASARGDTMGNRALCTITVPSGVVTLRAQVRWLKGWPEFLLRLHGNHMEAFGRLNVPPTGTPGARNSRALNNAAPAIYEVTHSPVLPAALQPAVVTARVHDPDGVSALTLRYRVDPSATYTSVAMMDNGAGGDAIAGDGVFSATIPAPPAATPLVAFQVTATDSLGANQLFPLQVPGNYALPFECLVRFGDPILTSSFGTYRQWYTAASVNMWINRPALSNEKIYGTFVYGNVRVIYNISAKYSSSPYHQGQHSSPVSGSVHYTIDLPVDDQCLGTENWNKVHAPGNSAFDENTNQREQIGYWFARQMGLPWNYRRFVHMIVNGTKKGSSAQIMEDTERAGDDFVDSRFPNDRDGNLYKMQPWFEVDDGTALTLGFANANWCTLNRYRPGTNAAVHLTPRYRQNWLVRAAGQTANDFSQVYALVDAANTPTNGWAAHTAAMEGLADMEEWLRIFAVCHSVGDWDHFGTQNSQNMYGYKPQNGKWTLMIWDFNILLGNSGSWGPGTELFNVNDGDPVMNRLYAGESATPSIPVNPYFRRAYLRGLKEMCRAHMTAEAVYPVIDARQGALTANGVNVPAGNVTTLKNWIRDARVGISNAVMAQDAANFVLTVTNDITTSNNYVNITRLAPVEMKGLWLNGVEYPVVWTSVRNWSIILAVTEATNVLDLQGYDVQGRPLPGFAARVTVNYTGPIVEPEGALVFNEIMYNPAVPEASYVEVFNRSGFAFDVSGWRVNGLDFTFGPASIIAGGQYLVLCKNRGAFSAAYGGGVAPFGQFDGGLDDGGETISLERPVEVYSTNGASIFTNISWVAVNRVRYDDDAPWPAGADGFGPALQLIDASRDNRRVSNWIDREGWRYVSYTGTIAGPPAAPGTNLLVFLNSAGDVYVDDLVLVTGVAPEVGPNLIVNGGFESPLAGSWDVTGNHSNSAVSTEFSHSGSGSLHIIAGANGGANAAVRQFLPVLPTNTVCTLSFWMRPSTNGAVMTTRTTPGSLFNGTNGIRPSVSTPGVANVVAAALPAYDALWLNELQPNNVTGIVDNQGDREPWIELYNSGATTLDLSGYYLADNYGNNLTQWQFPAGSTLGPGAFKVVWADGQPGQSTAGDWHTSFRLQSATGSVALVRLVASQPQITDYLNYSGIGADLSYGDFPNGQPVDRQTFFSPTPGGLNQGREVNVFVNEWMAANTNLIADPADAPALAYDDWFELYNASDSAVDLGGYWLTDNLGAPRGFQIPTNGQYVIPPRGFLLVWADDEVNQNSESRPDLHASFQLSRDGEQIGLFAPNGSTLIDGVTFGPQTNNISEGRFADGAPARYFMTSPTPRGPNTLGAGGTAPVIDPIADRTVTLGQTVSLTVTATDADLPPQILSYSLDGGFPIGAAIDSGSGLFTWMPTPAQAPSTNALTVRVTDSGAPPLSATRSFTVTVRTPPRATITVDASGHVTLGFATIPGRTYRVEYKDNLNAADWLPLGASILANGGSLTVPDDIGGNPQRFYRIVQLD